MKRIASTAVVILALLATAGCGGSNDTDSPTVTEDVARETPAVETTPAPTTTVEAPPATKAEEQPSAPATTADEGPGPAEVARAFAAASERQDWPTVCDLYSRSSMAQLRAGAAGAGIDGDTCPEILLGVFGEGMVLPTLDASGEATVDGDRATVGEITLVREDGDWKVEDDA